MRTIYLDKDYLCHAAPSAGCTPHETDAFDGKCDEYINGYRLVPAGASWTNENGITFTGEMLCPAQDFTALQSMQSEEEHAALLTLGAVGEAAPAITAQKVRAAMNTAAAALPDETALACAALYPAWDAHCALYAAGERVQHGGALYKCVQGHPAQSDWAPDTATSLWTPIANPAEEWPLWSRPLGSHDAYEKGAKITFENARYISAMGENIYSPSEYPTAWLLQP